MNIAIFTNNYLPNPYGVTRSIETFRQELEKRNHKVFIFAPRWKGYEDKNPRVFRYPSLDIKIKFRFPLAIPYSWKMDKIIKNLNLDVIHAQHPNLLGSVGMKWARKSAKGALPAGRQGSAYGGKIPLIFTWHTLYDKYTNFVPFIPSKIVAGYIIRKAVNFANKADAVIAPTDSIIPILKKWGVSNKNVIAIPTGVLEEEFANADGKKIIEKYKIEKDETVLLLVSRLTAEKNVEFVFESVSVILKNINPPLREPSPELDYQLDLSRVQARRGKVKFLVVGDGYLRESLEKFCVQEKISDQVIFCGEVERAEIKNFYACADIFIYGSKSETQGMIITEAMYMGLPIVALNATGINSLVLNNGNGFLVSESEKEFEKAVLKLIEDAELRKKFGETSVRIAKLKFTASICTEKMLEVYEEAIENKK